MSIKSLASSSKATRVESIKKLVQIGEDAIDPLMEVMSSKSKEQKVSAAQALALIGKPAINSLVQRLSSKNDRELEMVAYSLSRMSDLAVPYMSNWLLTSNNELAEKYIIYAFEKIGMSAREAIPAIATKLRSSNIQVQLSALTTIRKLGYAHPTAVNELAEMLDREKTQELLIMACRALAYFGPDAKPAISSIERLIHSEDKILAEEARDALKRIDK